MPDAHSRRPPVVFLVFDAYDGGGVARTTTNLANRLAQTHAVRVVGLYRRRRVHRFELDPAVEVRSLVDLTRDQPRWARALRRPPSRLRPNPSASTMSLLTDLMLWRYLRTLPAGSVVVSTRPSLHLASTAFVRRGVTTIGWEHLHFSARFNDPSLSALLRASLPRLDGFVVLTEADAADYRRELPAGRTQIEVIRNSVSWPSGQTAPDLDSRIIVAAGRLRPRKGFKRLIRSFAPIARRHPGWQLHIYGNGEQKQQLLDLIERLGVGRQVRLRGYSDDFPSVLAHASMFAMTSLSEGFPMVLIEAMSQGVPVIAFDCPRGPGEIIRHGQNGLLIPEGPNRRFTEGLRVLVEDADLRRRLGAQALRDAEGYTIDSIAAHWERLFAQVGGAAERRGVPAGTPAGSE